jgi:predicted nucleic acid-binding Zn ribbon protein
MTAKPGPLLPLFATPKVEYPCVVCGGPLRYGGHTRLIVQANGRPGWETVCSEECRAKKGEVV